MIPARQPYERQPPGGALLNFADPLSAGIVFDFDPVTFADRAQRNRQIPSTGNLRSVRSTGYVAALARGSSQAISLGDPSFFDFGAGNFSFEFIFTLASGATSTTRMQILAKDVSGGRQIWCELNTQASGATDNSIALVWINGTTAQQRSPVNSIVVGQRQHVVCQRVGNSVEFYIDGVQVTTTAGAGHTGFPAVAASTTTAYLGRRAFSGAEDYFDGSIELARVRNRALTAREIASLARNPYQIYGTSNFQYIDTAVSGGGFLAAWAVNANSYHSQGASHAA
jgi:hypothetical protein